MIPLIFIEYLLWKYHLKNLIIRKRRWHAILKMFFDNFKWYVKLNRLMGTLNSYWKKKPKYPRNYYNSIVFRKRKKLKRGFFFRWERFRNLYVKMAPLGSYYYWYGHLNKKKFYMCYYKFFFISIYKTKYYKYLVLLYIILILYIYRKFKLDVMYSSLKKIQYIRLLEIYNNIIRLK